MDRHSLPANVVEALRRGNKIEAIKLLREATHVGLAEAKGVVDALESHAKATQAAQGKPPASARVRQVAAHQVQRRPRVDDLGPGEVPRTSMGAAAMVILIAIVVLGLWVFLK